MIKITGADPRTDETLVSNAGQPRASYLDTAWIHAQPFTTGPHADGYTFTTVDVYLGTGTDDVTVSIYSNDEHNEPGSSLYTLTPPGTLTSNAFNTFTAPANATLSANTIYHVYLESGDFSVGTTTSLSEDDGLIGWSLADFWLHRNEPVDAWNPVSDDTLLIKITNASLVSPPPPSPPPPPPPPSVPPDAPRNLRSDGVDGAVTLSWDAPRSNGGAAITDYEYQIDGVGEWISIGSTIRTYTVTGLTNGTVYVFRVRAVNRAGAGRASRQVEATSGAVLDFPHFANGTGITSEVVFVNLSSQPTRPALYFSDPGGDLIDPTSVVDVTGDLMVTEDGSLTLHTVMEPWEELTIATHGRGELVSGSLRVVTGVPIGGVVRYGVPMVGVTGVGAGLAVRDALFPTRRQEEGIRTAAALHNLGEEAIEVTCRLMRGGVALEEAAIPLEANGQTSWFIEEVFTMTDTTDFVGTVRCTAPGQGRFSGLAVEVDQANRIFTTLPVVEVDRTGGSDGETVLDFAHFANGTWVTDLVFVNPSIEPSGPPLSPFHSAVLPTRPSIYFYDTEGDPIAAESVVDLTGDLEITEDGALTLGTGMVPLGVLTISTHGRGGLVTGSVRVVSEGPIGGMLRFAHPALGVAGVGAGLPVSDAMVPVRRQEGGINTGVALHNLESSSSLLRCELMQAGVLRDSVSIPLAANGQTSWSIDQAFPATDTSDFLGSLRCSAPGGDLFTAVALEMDSGARTFTTLPVVPVPEMPSRE